MSLYKAINFKHKLERYHKKVLLMMLKKENDELIKRDHTPNFKNHGIRRLGTTNIPFNGILCTWPCVSGTL